VPHKLPKKEYLERGNFPVVSQEATLVSGYHNEQAHVFNVSKPVVIFGDHTQVLKYVDFDFVIGADGVKILLPIEEIDTKYFYYLLQALMPKGKGYARHYRLLKELNVSIPPLAEQQRIVAKLDAAFAEIDSAVSITQKKIGEGLKLKGNIISKFISDRKFEQKSLDNICLIGDGNHSSNYPKASEMVNEGVPFLRAGNIQNGKIDATDLKFISLEKHEILKKGHLKFGDVLLTNRGEIGKTAIIPKEFDGANLNSQVAWLRCGEGLDENYLYYCLNSKEVCEEFVANKTGAALQQLTIKKIKQLKIPVPSFAEQMKIVEALNAAAFALEQLNDAMSAQIHKYQSLKKAILAQELRSEAA
jgi:type I restriction enzyme S subunit